MRFMFKISMPIDAGNVEAHKGFATIQKILAEQKPEAVYFLAEGGQRTGIVILNMTDMSQLPSLAEPWFLALNASIEVTPVMTPEDLMKAGPSIAHAVKTYGG